MLELIQYLGRINWDPNDVDEKVWVDVNDVIKDLQLSRDKIFRMACKAKSNGLIIWKFNGFFSNECIKQLSITKKGRVWIKMQNREEKIVIPEFLMKAHQQH